MDKLEQLKKDEEAKADSKENKSKISERLEQATKVKKLTKTSEEDLANHGFKIGKVLGEGSYSTVK